MILLPGIEQLAFTGMTFRLGAVDRGARRLRLSPAPDEEGIRPMKVIRAAIPTPRPRSDPGRSPATCGARRSCRRPAES